MKKTETEYITFEQASLLKEKGFDEECKTVFYQADNAEICVEDFIEDETIGGYYTKRAEQYKVVEWLRINYGIHVTYEWDYSCSSEREYYFYKIKFKDNDGFIKLITGESVSSPQEAYSTAFDYIKSNNLI
jgi:hypothetical protein